MLWNEFPKSTFYHQEPIRNPKMKYMLLKKMPRLYFKEYQGRNKPIWTDNHLEAAQYDREQALRMQKRLVCQSQVVVLCGKIENEHKCCARLNRLNPDTSVSPNKEK